MPLKPGHSKAVVSNNIREMMHAGHPQKQAVAASLNNARKHPGKKLLHSPIHNLGRFAHPKKK